jgi:hypothetical protein
MQNVLGPCTPNIWYWFFGICAALQQPMICFLQCNAKWVLTQHWRSYQKKRALNQQHDQTTVIKARSAEYCKGPFFTWMPNQATATHVGVHTGLYMDLIVLMKSLEESSNVTSTQLERIENYNATRVKDGRFLFGHGIADEARGGIFVLDVSSAQPHSAPEFVVHQLSQTLEFWCAHCSYLHGNSDL